MATNKTIYEKLADAREAFHELELKKTGRNRFANYDYFELGDFLIPALKCLRAEGLVPLPVVFKRKKAIMTIKEFTGDGEIVFESPMIEAKYTQEGDGASLEMYAGAKLKGCHPIQNLGAVESYQRRYLWVALMEIVEHDALDATTGSDDSAPAKKVTKKKAASKKATPPSQDNSDEPDMDDDFNDDTVINNETDAKVTANTIITLAKKMHSNSIENLTSFWKKNYDVIEFLQNEYPDEYERIKSAFGTLRKRIQSEEDE